MNGLTVIESLNNGEDIANIPLDYGVLRKPRPAGFELSNAGTSRRLFSDLPSDVR